MARAGTLRGSLRSHLRVTERSPILGNRTSMPRRRRARRRRWRGCGRLRAALLGKVREIFLARLEPIHLGARRTFGVHGQPDRPDHHPNHTGSDILRDLGVVLLGELFGLDIVRLNLRADHGAIALRVLRLDDGDRMRVATKHRHPQLPTPPDAHRSARHNNNVHETFYTTFWCLTTDIDRGLQELELWGCGLGGWRTEPRRGSSRAAGQKSEVSPLISQSP